MKINFKKTVVVIISMLASVLVLSACQTEKAAEVPAGFSLTWTSGPTHADRGAHNFIKITKSDSGQTYVFTSGKKFSFISKEDGARKKTTSIELEKKLTSDQMLELYQLIIDEDILDMKERYRNPDIMDGDYKLLNISWQGVEKKVSAVNMNPDGLKKVRSKLNQFQVP